MYVAIGVEPTNETAWMSGCSRIASTATLSPCTTLNTPSGTPASCKTSATNIDALGSFSEGLSTNVFPHAIALANIHMGTIAGKLNGRDPGHHAERLADREHVDPRRDLLGEAALQQVGDRRRELDVLDAALDLARGVGDHLAVLRARRSARAPACAGRAALAAGRRCRRACESDVDAPAPERFLRGLHARRRDPRRVAKSTSCVCSPVAGL